MDHTADTARAPEEGLRFARRMYLPRTLGLACGALAIGSVLWENGAPDWTWVALALNCFAWPPLAYLIASRSANPYRAELRNLTIDSACGGAWVPLISFNLLVSVLLIVMLSMDKISVGGGRFRARTAAAQLAAGIASALAFGFDLQPETTQFNVMASLPLLVFYPIAVGITTYRLSRRVRDQNRILAELSRTDGLTGLLNRRYWEEAVSDEFQRCRRAGHVSALLMLDIDHFKAINDRHGHQVGDEVIRSVAAILRDTLRQQDVPGRYGGEEFGVLLPGTSAEGALVIAERVRKRIEAAVLERRHALRATISIGISVLRAEDARYADWLQAADRALYQAKDQGRNRTVLHAAAAGAAAG